MPARHRAAIACRLDQEDGASCLRSVFFHRGTFCFIFQFFLPLPSGCACMWCTLVVAVFLRENGPRVAS